MTKSKLSEIQANARTKQSPDLHALLKTHNIICYYKHILFSSLNSISRFPDQHHWPHLHRSFSFSDILSSSFPTTVFHTYIPKSPS
ncbi:hypothetical protein QVD17_31566 [Tagetes erecta]|uniref:Uncharacterized protein n=1 Tax=Tagetes erecta TaxID=13708 RepID=A0AAD8K3P1_TARER|nr:hypothetical protein QVD17_31566 [Tagetes erecta]